MALICLLRRMKEHGAGAVARERVPDEEIISLHTICRKAYTMKILIASDIHGSALYCERLLERYRAEGADRLLLLGDILYHGPRNDLPEGYAPKAVIAMLNPLKNE